jgi:hypothetical protein
MLEKAVYDSEQVVEVKSGPLVLPWIILIVSPQMRGRTVTFIASFHAGRNLARSINSPGDKMHASSC